ncbi:ABC transporter ATP-binding protein [Pseudolabrys sp. FHR47]|uniref:ABC transporter ATP-binding protein n=1 Tax=Pseudolabrys sp. FHR47 TaxID=2562284 RepID=UPI0010BF4B2E|nr:ABC transporter ATP-binding protein [Pseudolabrys sp. FHR47]
MTPPKLDLRGVTKRYGDAVALHPTDLTVANGEFLTLLGPSGSGKTTLLMMIAGLTETSGGHILLDGHDITLSPAYRREIGVVFQNYALFPHLSVFENVAFPLRMRKQEQGRVKAAVGRALDLVRLGHLASRLPNELSGGQQQRVAFARAIVFEPQLVLMDEPLGALDKKLRDELKLEIRKLHAELKKTIVYVTHDQEEAMLLSDRVCLMNEACVEQIDTPVALYDRPRSRFAAAFVGESNLIDGVVRGGAIDVAGCLLRTAYPGRLPPEGHKVTVLVRPERLRIAAVSENSAFTGTVIDIIHLGAVHRLVIAVGGGLTLTMTVLGGAHLLEQGATIAMAVSPEDVVPLVEAP